MLPPNDKKKGSSTKALVKSRAMSSAAARRKVVPALALREGTSVNPSAILGLKASVLENLAMAEKLLEGVIPPTDKEDAIVLRSSLADATVERLEKEVAELKKKEALVKKSVIEEYKSLDDFQEAFEFVASRYFGEGFDFCKRQIGHLHLDIDIQDIGIDAELLEEDEEESGDEEEEKEGQ
ncbi:hypothetical protein Acr_24g0006750 [Actinidia rufa]|uniref:Uncharacterized protein n=1 Tax=Actinidia rufa TaxID=165716 RepID=A0A7J0GUG6_9ERIC|nr:hypothetical protein Acr_24g0006750 [Actinidia rufa]